MKKDKIVKDFKLYNVIMSNFWKLIATVLIGAGIGYIATSKSEDDQDYMLICIIVFFVIGIINFFVGIIKEMKKLDKLEEKKKEKMNEKN